MKDWVDFSRSSLHDFNIKFSKFTDWQNLEEEKALYSQGQYTLDDQYSDLKVEYNVWKRMDANARQNTQDYTGTRKSEPRITQFHLNRKNRM